MANTVITITIPEAQTAHVVKALCETAGIAVTNANAKALVIREVRRQVEEYDRRTFSPEPVELT